MTYLFLLLFSLPSLLFGLTTGPFITISNTGGNSTPQIAVSSGGNASAIWLNFPNTIQFAYFNAATGLWTPPLNLAVGSNAQIGIDGVGNTIVVWVSQNQIFASRFNVPTLTFSPPVQLSSLGGSNNSPKLAVNDVGTAVVVWLQNNFTVLSASLNPATLLWTTIPISFAPTTILGSSTYPAAFGLDNSNKGLAIFQTVPQNIIQVTRILAP